MPVFEPATELGLVARWQSLDELVGHALFGSGLPSLRVAEALHVPDADVLARDELIAHEVLKDDADPLSKHIEAPGVELEPVERNPAFGRLVEPGEQLDQRGLSGPVLADQGELAPGVQVQAHVAQGGVSMPG